ncbi:hypothetical protein GGI09_001858 [Coemansia sp. S100]|nr:hypothetical protein LPJ71_000755 [Coemansia sp. S17]KAJ2018245.1 hypothetical protein GGI14_002440 [Coemansia sp. S680]KAJ2061565.1 hypothetical protein GGH13_006596 [Coemansia sp. S155-1]KAJ2101250.1 hypothetical protein GGI09_001858 [Coemansia sp. S100]KAJ2421624.1 hypothetical protein GGF41_003803 [Coemansia sp. RSA 2531]
MFIRPRKPEPEPHVRHTLSELGYEFDLTSGKLRNSSTGEPYEYSAFGTDKKKNAELYQSLLAPASRDVYRVLQSDLGMEPIAVPDSRQPHCNIYVTPGGLTKKHLVVIVTGHGVSGGVWAWNVLVKEGLRAGSVIEYVRGCVKRGYGVLVLNPNENIVASDGLPETFNTYVGHSTPIHGNETPDEHVGYVWSRIIRGSSVETVAFVAYNTAGIAVIDLLRYDFARFIGKSVGIAFIDSVHSTFKLERGALAWLGLAAKQWENSDEPADSLLEDDRVGCVSVSAGNPSDCRELAPMACMESVLDFISSCFERGTIETSLDNELSDNDGTESVDLSDADSGTDTDAIDDLTAIDSIQVVQPGGHVVDDGCIGWD